MSILRRVKGLFGSNQASARLGACDTCSASLSTGEGYLLTTAEVVTSEGHWKRVLQAYPVLEMLKSDKDKILEIQQLVSQTAASDTPWMACSKCISLFSVDRGRAMRAAAEWRRTGEPSQGSALCKLEGEGLNMIVKVADDTNYRAALNAATKAYKSL